MEKEITINDIMAHYTEEEMAALAIRQENPFFQKLVDTYSKYPVEKLYPVLIALEQRIMEKKDLRSFNHKLALLQGAINYNNKKSLKRTLANSSIRYYN